MFLLYYLEYKLSHVMQLTQYLQMPFYSNKRWMEKSGLLILQQVCISFLESALFQAYSHKSISFLF